MKISDFINNEFFNLPKSYPNDVDFKKYVFEQLETFLNKINELKCNGSQFDDVPYSFESIEERQIYLVNQTKRAIENYYDGKPGTAYNDLAKGLNSKVKNFEEVMYQFRFPPNESFYRIRKIKDNFALPSTEFFHIPFNKRGLVKTQRYSIPGFPSLYLGTTLYVCWEELKRPNINEFQAVRLKNLDSIRVLNLVPPIEEYRSSDRLYKYLMLWPLIFCSSIKVNNDKDSFKPEYIIPQLLLQWVRNKNNLDGIMYQTTHIDFYEFNFKGEFVNVVLPVKENKTEGLCEHLKKKFEMTAATSIQLNELSSPVVYWGDYFDYSIMNSKIQQLEKVKGRVFPYSHSKLGELETILLQMNTKPI
jgi:hypothetical protein